MNKNDDCCKFVRKITDREVSFNYVYTGTYNDIHQIVWHMFDSISSKKPGYQLIVLGSLYQLIGTIFSENYYNPTPDKPPRDHRRIVQLKQALEFIESSYNKPISLQEMADSVQMSPKYFCRFFQEMTHRSPVDYLNYYRIERACYQLLTTNDTITEVAYNSGFNDLSYFIKTFKKYKGTTPKQYLK